MATRVRSTVPSACSVAEKDSGRRYSGWSVSGIRAANHRARMPPSASIETNTQCHEPSSSIVAPMAGPSIGTIRNTIMMSDITLAISRPAKRSRTIAVESTLPPAAPMPWMTREASSHSKLGATIASPQPAA